MRSKPEVLVLTDWFVPGYKAGGPIQSVSKLVNELEDNIDFSVITGDRDLMEKTTYSGVPIDSWVGVSNHRRYYSSDRNLPHLMKSELEKPYDFVYMNSFFSSRFTIKPLFRLWKAKMLQKVVLAPRGMLGAGALSIKPLKKRVFITLFKMFGVDKKLRFHATDLSEAVDIQKVFGPRNNIIIVSNFPVQLSTNTKEVTPRKPLKLVYASRFSPKKNPLFILNLLPEIKGLDYQFALYGTVDDPIYFDKCRKMMEQDKHTRWHEALPPPDLYKILRQSHFFVLPTLNENFGHAIIEALAHGTPVIISDQTPWNDLETFGAGWVIPLSDKERWKKTIRLAADLSDGHYQQMCERAIEYVKRKFDFSNIKEQYLNLFH